ncbi:MAG: imidazole glycerol phosphate synthase subunit HisH [Gammaproteobacteria bacterium]|nr:imidazole glycerol phosphate synthase subunit HisH [Gammaproteobacteria bacterium]
MSAVVIIDYDAGNLRSVQRACQEVGISAEISSDPERVRAAQRVIFPGVGAAGSAMRSLKKNGLDVALREVLAAGTPVLGICLGLQISLDRSEENDQQTLGLLPGCVKRFEFQRRDLKIPHMGWNEVRVTRRHPVLEGIEASDEFYFVHAYYPEVAAPENIYAVTDYEHEFASALGKDNYFATQFHPEKSGRVGLRLLKQFASWDGSC